MLPLLRLRRGPISSSSVRRAPHQFVCRELLLQIGWLERVELLRDGQCGIVFVQAIQRDAFAAERIAIIRIVRESAVGEIDRVVVVEHLNVQLEQAMFCIEILGILLEKRRQGADAFGECEPLGVSTRLLATA